MEFNFNLEGGNFSRAGAASSEIKKILKQLNVDALLIKRIVVALYEAEVNVVAHAYEGVMNVVLDGKSIVVTITDKGPGIPDIAKAMQEGFSTASPEVREMGFGAGMGLPNMKKNCDRLNIESTVNVGTKVTMTKHYLQQHPRQRPFISSFCPAVVRLIQVRFPSLIGHIVRLKQAMDIAAIYVRKKYIDKGIPEKEIGVFYVTQCAAKIAAIKCPVGEESSPVDGVINMDFIYNKILLSINRHKSQVLPRVPEQYHLTPQSIQWTLSGGEASNYPGRCLAIDEIHNVIDILEKLENDELTDIDFLELRACDHSCAGGALAINNRFLTIERLQKRMENYIKYNYISINKMPRYKDFLVKQMQLSGEIPPRSIEKLDEDLSVAFQKMEKITRIMKVLPQIDCGACGTPSCQALAQDVVQGKAKLNQCIFMQKILTREGLLTPEESMELSAKVWGIGKFEKNEE